MGLHKDEGIPEINIIEECGEVIQVVAKFLRFDCNWDTVPPGKELSRWEEMEAEMADLLYQWERLKRSRRKGLKTSRKG